MPYAAAPNAGEGWPARGGAELVQRSSIPSLDRWGGENTALNRPLLFTSTITDMPHQTHQYAVANPSPYLSEEQVQDAFHSYLKSSLTQAKVEGLLPANVLSSAEGDLMVTGEQPAKLSVVSRRHRYRRSRTMPLLRRAAVNHRTTIRTPPPPLEDRVSSLQPLRRELPSTVPSILACVVARCPRDPEPYPRTST